jgi:hypothetical protein
MRLNYRVIGQDVRTALLVIGTIVGIGFLIGGTTQLLLLGMRLAGLPVW